MLDKVCNATPKWAICRKKLINYKLLSPDIFFCYRFLAFAGLSQAGR